MDFSQLKPELAQAALQAAYAGLNVLTRVCLLNGMNQFVFVTYRQVIAAIAIAPLAHIKESKDRPPITLSIFLQIFVLALVGITFNQNFFYAGMSITGSTFAAAMCNLLPACAFIMSLIVGIERLEITTIRGKAKVVGTVGCVCGAMIMTFYKGSAIKFMKLSSELGASAQDTLIGSCFLLGSILSWSTWLTVQSYVVKRYPAHLTMTGMMLGCAAVQSAIVALIFDRPAAANPWKIGCNMELFICLYAGLLCSALALFVQSWCVEKRGPVFVAVFSPLCTVLVAMMEICILHYTLHVGSLVGAVVIAIGLYLVLWGKTKQERDIVAIQNLSQEKDDTVKHNLQEKCIKIEGYDTIDTEGNIRLPLLHRQ